MRTHGARSDEGLGAVQRDVDAEGGLFQGVGAVEHDGASDVGFGPAEVGVGNLADVEVQRGVERRAAAGEGVSNSMTPRRATSRTSE